MFYPDLGNPALQIQKDAAQSLNKLAERSEKILFYIIPLRIGTKD
jgi:hypothetical protein